MQSILDLGADVDSRSVMVACAADSFKPHRIPNERKSILAWLRTVPRGSRLGMESTGTYHELLAGLAQRAGLQVFIVNARDLRRYSQGIGRRGKTDRVDAEVIARYVAREHGELHAYVAPTRAQRTFARLVRRRTKLVDTRSSITQSLRGVPQLKTEARRLINHIDEVIEKVDLLMQRTLEQMPDAAASAKYVVTIPGIGVLTSRCLGYRFTRLPYATSDAVVAATGLDPQPHDSGDTQGPRRLSKCGAADERRLLFNCGRAATRTKVWRPYFDAQLAKGLSKTEATVVLARKMLRVAFALHKRQQPFDPLLIGG